ncbi:hypothetical protein G9F71_017925 [Clostridium sp. FP2]|uniref:hypothetical protein n=1 Tax=Clostridium sp. FP2 TaxID=2724481 RepID=UPI001CCF0CEF|nr:hypothetical protein [Clostridium sp. FP2]MBZ9624731.1 hypothetical protein [Clostridium sp. FP2]
MDFMVFLCRNLRIEVNRLLLWLEKKGKINRHADLSPEEVKSIFDVTENLKHKAILREY